MNKHIGLLGRKVGMTQIFSADGTLIPVSVVEAGPCTILQVKSPSSKDGYSAIQIAFSEQKAHRITKAQGGHFAKANTTPKRYVRELRLPDVAAYSLGQVLTAGELFKAGDKVDVGGTSKGRGFAGVFKRHHFKGFIRSHGTHEFFRHGGSLGTRLTPGMVQKGMKMPGHLGSSQCTVMNLTIAKVDAEQNLIFIRGAIPGATGGLVTVRGTEKNIRRRGPR